MNTPWQNRFADNAALLPLLMDLQTDQVMLVRLTEQEYRKISFLDQRIIEPQLPRQLVEWKEISTIPLPPLPKPQYIFHIGHVGSTLISRLLGECENILALREPAILRQLSELYVTAPLDDVQWRDGKMRTRLKQTENWLSRTFRPHQRTMIKASSFVSPLAELLLDKDSDGLFLYTHLDRYLQTILAGEFSLQEAETLSDIRLMRLNRYLGSKPLEKSQLSSIQIITLGWLCEMVTLTQAGQNLPQANIMWMDFDIFLADPANQLQITGKHFGLDIPSSQAETLVNGPIMTSYSKAQEYDYSPSLREELLKESFQKHRKDINSAIHWVDKLAGEHKPIALALEQAEKR